MKIDAGPCTSYIFIIKTETAPKSPVGGGGYGDLSPNRRQKIKDIRNTEYEKAKKIRTNASCLMRLDGEKEKHFPASVPRQSEFPFGHALREL